MLASGSIGTDCVTVATFGLAEPVEDGAVATVGLAIPVQDRAKGAGAAFKGEGMLGLRCRLLTGAEIERSTEG